MSRKPARPRYDALVDLYPPESLPEVAYGLVKLTYRITDEGCVLDEDPEPLFGDIRDPEASPRMPPGSDFWIFKVSTDVAVRGSAFCRSGRSVQERLVGVRVGDREKSIRVFGNRVIDWRRGRLRFSEPQPFDQMPLVWSLAYGGYDGRVPPDEPPTVGLLQRLEFDHPGLYPRNPFGKGYIVLDEPVEGVELPNLEDPAFPLMPDNLIVGDPRLWYRQPLPACFEFTCAVMFHRYIYLGAGAWHHPPGHAVLEEVERGWIPENYQELREGQVPIPIPFYQEAAPGLSVPTLQPGTPISAWGMHPEDEVVTFLFPEPPRVAIEIDGQSLDTPPEPTNVLFEPAEKRLQITYLVTRDRDTFPRVFVPGIHARIPLSLSVDEDDPIRFEPPPTLRDRRLAGPAKPEAEAPPGAREKAT